MSKPLKSITFSSSFHIFWQDKRAMVTTICVSLALLLWGSLFVCGLMSYQGSKAYYILFSVLFAGLLLSGVIKPPCYSYLFLSVMLWLGFWVKFTYHTILDLSYQEEVGAFINTPASLDEVIVVASLGCLGVLLARGLYSRLRIKINLVTDARDDSIVPIWYIKYRKIFIYTLVASMFAAVALNFWLGIFHIGLVPKTILLWPLNALISWLLTIGFALIVSTIMWWEVCHKQSLMSMYCVALMEGFTMSITVMSRGLYIFHVIPVAIAWIFCRKKAKPIGYKKIIGLGILTGLLFVISLQCVSVLRVSYYDGMPIRWSTEVKTPLFLKVINQLVIDRWLGVEGVMAISSYSDKGWKTFHQALVEKSEIGQIGIYQKIAKSVYRQTDLKKFLFATLPGLVGFLYLSNSFLVVCFGAFVLTFLMMLGERLVFYFTKNPFLCAVFAMTAANTLAQFGVAPVMIFKQYFLIYGYLGVVYLLQNHQSWKLWFTRLMSNDKELVL